MSSTTRASFENRVLACQAVICLVTAAVALFWGNGGIDLAEQGVWQMAASALGSIAIIAPSAVFAWWSRRLLVVTETAQGVRTASAADAEGSGQVAQRVMGLAGVKLVVTMTLMVIAFALMRPQAAWVLVGIAAAAIASVVAAGLVSALTRGRRQARDSTR